VMRSPFASVPARPGVDMINFFSLSLTAGQNKLVPLSLVGFFTLVVFGEYGLAILGQGIE
jgi:hypothetical protein